CHPLRRFFFRTPNQPRRLAQIGRVPRLDNLPHQQVVNALDRHHPLTSAPFAARSSLRLPSAPSALPARSGSSPSLPVRPPAFATPESPAPDFRSPPSPGRPRCCIASSPNTHAL